MFETAAGFALLAAVSPTALLVGAVYLGSASPRRTMTWYLLGAIVMTVIVGIIVLIVLRAGGLSLPSHRQPRYGVRLGLGVLALAAGVYMLRRKPKPPNPGKEKKPGMISRLMARPGPVAAFLTGIIVFVPSISFVAAVQVIATSRDNVADTSAALALVIVIDLAFVWLPFVLYLARPEGTTRTLRAFNGWLRRHGHAIAAGALLVVGVLLVVDGAVHLA
jgi:uncharacterized membrane protein